MPVRFLACAALLLVPFRLAADESPAKVKPIRALLITGGCCHDYERQKQILAQGIAARAPIEFEVVHQGGSTTDTKIPVYENDDWAKGFDVVIHNECFAGVTDPAWTARVLKPHRQGLPAVVIHCAMHCYRDKTDEWFKFLGVTSHGHGANYPFDVLPLDKDHPVMRDFGDRWTTPKGELYLIAKLWPTATPLAHALSRDSKKHEVCIWTNVYNSQTRVFGTTLGHHNEEMEDPVFLNVVTRGLLWAVDKLDDRHFKPLHEKQQFTFTPSPGSPGNKPVVPAKQGLVPINLAKGKLASATGSQPGHPPEHAVDGDYETRWCSPDGRPGQTWTVDLQKSEEVVGCEIVWEFDGRPYKYRVEGSSDAKDWAVLADHSAKGLSGQVQTLKFDPRPLRYVRLTVTGLPGGSWGSFYEFEVHGKELVPASVDKVQRPTAKPGAQGPLAGIKVPPGFDVTLFAAPPDIAYPTCLAAAPTGELFVGVDENGSLDAKPNRGRVVRCVDSDGDGKADKFTVFAKMDSPRGLFFDRSTLYVQHPPFVSAFHDDDGDGVADRSETLVKGLGFDLKFRGADHTTNGMQMGIDGWLYIAVGDYGFTKAVGSDGRERQLHGGGVVRVRPDGSELEIVSRGQRNIYDVAIDPFLNLFTRDNTNDGGGWDVRLSHVVPLGHYGYPSLFKNFPDEIVQPLADYGGGSPTGAIFLDEPLPEPFGNALYTVEWGRGGVLRHPLTPRGAGFTAEQKPFVDLPRPTDIEVDGLGRIYISSWKDGNFNYTGPNVGYVIRLTAKDVPALAFPDLASASDEQLVKYLAYPSHKCRLHTQREILRRGLGFQPDLEKLAAADGPLAVRVAALFTLRQLHGVKSFPALQRLAERPELREFAIKALTDRRGDVAAIPVEFLLASLTDASPRVRLQAAIGSAKSDSPRIAAALFPLTADADPLVSHVAINGLIEHAQQSEANLQSVLNATRTGMSVPQLRVLQSLHATKTVDLLTDQLGRESSAPLRRALLTALCRLHYREADWDGKWWGTRPDTSGPYFKLAEWERSADIARVLKQTLSTADAETLSWLLLELRRHKLDFPEANAQLIRLAATNASLRPAAIDALVTGSTTPAESIAFLKEVALADAEPVERRVKVIRLLDRSAEPAAADAVVQSLLAINRQAAPANDLITLRDEIVRDAKKAGRVSEFVKLAESSDAATREVGYGFLLQMPQVPAAAAAVDSAWTDPARLPSLLRAIGQTRHEPSVLRLIAAAKSDRAEIKQAAAFAMEQLGLSDDPNRVAIGTLPYQRVVAEATSEKGDAKLGSRLFVRQGCVACHTTAPGETLKGPLLAGITARYSRPELIESILKPSAKIAQGFETQWFELDDGRLLDGFVVRESGEEIEIRNAAGLVSLIRTKAIEHRGKRTISIMPTELVAKLTTKELASLLAYLETLKK